MPKYTALTPIKHDGKRYGVGDKLTLKVEDASSLLQSGDIEEVDTAAEKAAAEKAAAEKAAAEKAAAEKAAADLLAGQSPG